MKDGASMYNERGPETRKPSGAAHFTPGLTSRLVVTGLLCWALAGTAYAVLRLTFGDRPVSIHVRWAPTIDDAVRFQMEQRYQLAQAEPREDRTFGYALTDRSRDNIRKSRPRPRRPRIRTRFIGPRFGSGTLRRDSRM